jgi:hypothetical protein
LSGGDERRKKEERIEEEAIYACVSQCSRYCEVITPHKKGERALHQTWAIFTRRAIS